MGFTVLRFDDEEVLNDIVKVQRTLLGYVENFNKVNENNLPLPPREGKM